MIGCQSAEGFQTLSPDFPVLSGHGKGIIFSQLIEI